MATTLTYDYTITAGTTPVAAQVMGNFNKVKTLLEGNNIDPADSLQVGTSAQLLVANSSGYWTPTSVTGDVTISDTGVTTINSAFLESQRDTATVATSQTTTSGSWTDLATAGPSVALTAVAGITIIGIELDFYTSAAGTAGAYVGIYEATDHPIAGAPAFTEFQGGGVLGYSGTGSGLVTTGGSSGTEKSHGLFFLPATAGSRTYTLKYASNGSATATFANRTIWAMNIGGF